MSNKNWRAIHKWTAIGVGVFIVLWTFTGILMTIPPRFFQPKSMQPPMQPDFTQASLSPAQALEQVAVVSGKTLPALDMGLKQVHNNLAYWIVREDGLYLIDARSGDRLAIDEMLAEQIARRATASQAETLSDDLLSSHDAIYPFGPLPVYRIRFSDNPSIYLYVNKNNGDVSQSTTLTRVMAAIISLHTFEPVKLIFEPDRYRKGLLIIFSLVGIVTALTGYYLAVLPYLKRKTSKTKTQ